MFITSFLILVVLHLFIELFHKDCSLIISIYPDFLTIVYSSNVATLVQDDLICLRKNKVTICNHQPDCLFHLKAKFLGDVIHDPEFPY